MPTVAETREALSLITNNNNNTDSSSAMACNTLLADYQHNSVSKMLKEKYSSDNMTEEPVVVVETSDDINVCVDSRSSSPQPFTNGHTDEEKISENNVTSPTANGVDNKLSMEEYAAAFARHRLALMRGEPIPSDTSKLLRGMLQDKEKMYKMTDAHKNGGGVEDNVFINKLFQQQTGMEFRTKAGFDADTESLHSRSLTPQDTISEDEENKMDEDKVADDCSDAGIAEDDSAEAKRARVENIIVNMRTSPTRTLSDNNNVGESRRQKRKQYTPQQHGDGKECSSNKYGRMEPDNVKNHLHQMHQQLALMQNRNGHFDMFDKEVPFTPYYGDTVKRLSSSENIAPSPLERLDLFRRFPMVPYDANPFDPSNYLKPTNNNNKPVRDQELTRQQTNTETNNNDFNNLAKILKAEIANSVGTLVDSIVARFATQKNEGKRLNSFHHHDHHKERVDKIREDRNRSPDLNKHPRAKTNENKILNPLMENSMKFPELARSHHPLFPPPPYFPHMNVPSMQPLYAKEPEQTEALPLIVSTPKKKRTKVTDTRLSPRAARALLQENGHPLLDDKQSPLPQIPPHNPHLPPHPMLEHYHSPLIPVSLPTSVAIPNPSLQHSDVLAMYSHAAADHNNVFSDMLQQHHHMAVSRSPPMGDYCSPHNTHLPSDHMFMKNSEESFDSQSLNDSQSNYDGLQISFY